MIYECSLSQLPRIVRTYTVVRNTVWQIAEKENLLILVRDGRCTVETEGETHLLSAGDVLFLPQNCAYLRRSVAGELCTLTYVHFFLSDAPVEMDVSSVRDVLSARKKEADGELLLGNAIPFHTKAYLENVYHGEKEACEEAAARIRLISPNRPLTCLLESSAFLCGLLAQLAGKTAERLSASPADPVSQEVPPKLRRAIGYIVRHYSEPISLKDVARHCSVSPQQMIRYFKSAFGKTTNRYIGEYKVARAKELLFNEPQLAIKEVAAELGFENQHYFSRFFKAVTGETPGGYRERTVHYVEKE